MKKEKSKFKKIVLLIFMEIFVVLAISVITLLCIQTQFFFYPNSDEEAYNQLLSDENYDEVVIDNEGENLRGWLKYNYDKEEKAPLLIFFLGNYQNSARTFKEFSENHIFDYFSNYNILIVDYPEYGKSEGKISEETMFKAAEKTYDYANGLDCVDKNNIVVLGYSIGTGAATYISSQRDVSGLILVAPYDEALSLYNANVNVFYGPLKYLTTLKLESYKYASNVKAKTLIITSFGDEVINYEFSNNLAKYFSDLEEIIILDNKVKHSDYFYQKDVLERINQFLSDRIVK